MFKLYNVCALSIIDSLIICDRILENLPFGHIYIVVYKLPYLLAKRSCMSQTLQQQSLIFALSKCAIKISIEKLSEKFDCFVLKLFVPTR